MILARRGHPEVRTRLACELRLSLGSPMDSKSSPNLAFANRLRPTGLDEGAGGVRLEKHTDAAGGSVRGIDAPEGSVAAACNPIFLRRRRKNQSKNKATTKMTGAQGVR